MSDQPTPEDLAAMYQKLQGGGPLASYEPPAMSSADGSLPPDVVAHMGSQLGLIGQRGGGSAIAPTQTQGTGPMVPVKNYLGQTIGMRQADAPALFQNPFSHGPTPELKSEPAAQAPPVNDNGSPADASGQSSPAPAGFPRLGGGGGVSGNYEKRVHERQGLITDAANAQMESNAVIAAQRYADASEANERALAAQARQDARQAQIDSVMDKRKALSEAVASGKIDPDRLYGHADTGTRLGLILGGALGGAFQGWNHLNSNPFIDSVNLAIQRDIDAQKEQLASKKFALSENTNTLGQLRAQFGDERQADLAFHEMSLQITKQKLDATVQREQNPTILANAKLASNALDIELEATKARAASQAQTSTAGGMSTQFDQELYIPRAGGVASSKKEAEELRTSGSGYEKIQTMVSRALELRKDKSAFVSGTSAHAELAQIQAALVPAIQESNGFKRMSDADIKLDQEMAGKITSILPGADTSLHALANQKRQEEASKYKSAGVVKAQTGYAYTPNGRLVRTGAITGEAYAPTQMPKPIAGNGR